MKTYLFAMCMFELYHTRVFKNKFLYYNHEFDISFKKSLLTCVIIRLQNYHQNQAISVKKKSFPSMVNKKFIQGLCDFVNHPIQEHFRDVIKVLISTISNPLDE